MFFIKRKKAKVVKEDVAKVFVSNQDKIVLGAFCFTGMQKGNFFVKDMATVEFTATVEGNVTAMDCEINGSVKGNVFCTNNLWLGRSAVIEGTIMAKTAVMETGCRVNGPTLLAPKVEISTLEDKIAEAEKGIVKGQFEIRNVAIEETDILQISPCIREAKTLTEEPTKINGSKLEPTSVHSVESCDNWW